MTNGLDQLHARRGQTRRLPPAKHSPAPQPAAEAAKQPPAASGPEQPQQPTTPPRPAAQPPTTTAPEPATAELIRQTVYLDEAADELLERVRAAGRRRKTDANRSAVIRLALRRLADELNPDQIAGEIRKASLAASAARRPGRRLV